MRTKAIWKATTCARYKGRSGRGYSVNPGAGLVPGPGTPSDPLGFRDLLASKVGDVYSAVQDFPMQNTMFQPVGGMDAIAKAFHKRVGKQIRFHSEVQTIRQDADKVTVSYQDTASGKLSEVVADYCLCAIPLSVLRNIDTDFTPKFKDAIKSVAYAPVGKIGLQMKRRFWEEDEHLYGGHVLTDLKAINTISMPSTGWQSQKGVLLGYYHYATDAIEISALTPKERAEFALDAGQKIFPPYRASFDSAFSVAWHRVQYNLGGWAEWTEDKRKSGLSAAAGRRRPGAAGRRTPQLPDRMAGRRDRIGLAANRKNPRQGQRMTITRLLTGLALGAACLHCLPAAAQVPDGRAVFAKNCAACHQAGGQGIPDAFPALAGNAFVQGPADEVATVLLKGRGGMPDFSASLHDEDIALVLSYVRSSWGNRAAPVQADAISALRSTLQVAKAQDSKRANKH